MVGVDVGVRWIQHVLDTALLPAGCVSFVVHSLDGATVTHPLLAHLLINDEVYSAKYDEIAPSNLGTGRVADAASLYVTLRLHFYTQ